MAKARAGTAACARKRAKSGGGARLALAGQAGVLEMIAAARPLGESLGALVRLIEGETPGMLGSILLLDADGKHVRHGAAPSLAPAYSEAIDCQPIGPRAGSCGTAAYRRRQVIVEDIATDPLWADYRGVAARFGLRACWSTPIFDAQHRVLGTFAMYFRRRAWPSARHFRLIAVATHTAAIAITRDRGRRELARLTHDLGERVKELTLLTGAARLLQGGRAIDRALLDELVARVPAGWQYPGVCEARIRYAALEAATPGWRASRWTQAASFATRDGQQGMIEVAYLEERPAAAEGPFLVEERTLIDSLAEMLAANLERRRAEGALRNREALFRAAFENAAIGITLTDMEGRLLQFNPAFLRMLGYPEAELRNVRFRDITHPEDRAANESQYARLVAGEIEHFQLEKRYLHKDGRIVWGQLAVSLVKRESGAPLFTVGMVQDITASKEAEDRVQHLAYYDPVTQLPNRASLQERLAGAVDAARPARQPLALLLINLSNFSDINNTLGHRNGDLLLRSVAGALRETLRESDLVAGLGGDEFAVLLARLGDRRDIDLVMAKVGESLRRPALVAGVPIKVESAIGIALYPDHGDTAELLWQHAGVALRAARQTHRGHLLYAPEIDHYRPARIALLGELPEAIERDQLVLHYQPKVDLRTGVTVAVEALVRWQHPVHGLLFPDRFLVDAERTQLINPLTWWVLACALRQCRAWDAAGLRLGLSVNLSARNLHDAALSATILGLARDAQFPLERLTMEITESAIMADPVLAKSVLGELRRTGIHFSMDDFGIGQSSLAYVKDLPISKMKIDKSFVIGFGDARNAGIVRAAIELGRSLGLQVTAEGVEDEAAMQALRELGCDLGQGYYFAKPLPAGPLTTWLRESRWPALAATSDSLSA